MKLVGRDESQFRCLHVMIRLDYDMAGKQLALYGLFINTPFHSMDGSGIRHCPILSNLSLIILYNGYF